MKNILRVFFSTSIITILFLTQATIVVEASEVVTEEDVRSSGDTLISRVAPGEFLPISIKLLNFGNSKRVDVDVLYQIYDSAQNEIYATHDTVAVETTASFVKTIQIPYSTAPGEYTVFSSVTYQGQKVPATTRFPFTVEQKIIGLFKDQFYLYGGITLAISLLAGVVGHIWIKRRRLTRSEIFDYSDVPHDERVFYEIISDTILEMRQHIGDRALNIASDIDGLKIDQNTGRVLNIKQNPSKIVSELMAQFKVSL